MDSTVHRRVSGTPLPAGLIPSAPSPSRLASAPSLVCAPDIHVQAGTRSTADPRAPGAFRSAAAARLQAPPALAHATAPIKVLYRRSEVVGSAGGPNGIAPAEGRLRMGNRSGNEGRCGLGAI